MGEIFPVGETNDEISIERCRELLGEEALDLTDDEVDRIRICAETVAQAVLETFLDESRAPTCHCLTTLDARGFGVRVGRWTSVNGRGYGRGDGWGGSQPVELGVRVGSGLGETRRRSVERGTV